MKLTIEKAALLKTLSHVQSVVERRNTIPILSNVCLDASDGRLGMTTTDLDLQIIETVDANVADTGAITAPAHTLHDIVRKISEGAEVEIAYSGDSDGRMILAAGRSRFTLACLPRDDFPELTADDVRHTFSLDAADLKRLIDKSRFAISTEETRYYLNGIYLHVAEADGGNVLRAVATDGHRLARVELPAPDGSVGMPGVIVPRKAVNELRKLIDEFDGEVGIALSDTKIRFSFDSAVLTSKLIDGTFPDYTRVIPQGNDRMLEVDSRLFAEAVDRVSTISTDKSRPIKLALEGDKMTLSVSSTESGTATEEVAVTYQGEAMDIGFNARYLLDILGQIDGDVVRTLLADAASPTIMRDAEDESALYVLMPLRV